MTAAWNEPWDEELDDAEGPQECDLAGDSEDYETVACPHCGAEISELAEQCPHCGDWITPGGRARRSPWLVLLAVLLLVSFVWWLLR